MVECSSKCLMMITKRVWNDEDKDFCHLTFRSPGAAPSALVSCGNHQAQTCAACPQVIDCKTNYSTQWICSIIKDINFLGCREMVNAGAMEIVSGLMASASQVISCLICKPGIASPSSFESFLISMQRAP